MNTSPERKGIPHILAVQILTFLRVLQNQTTGERERQCLRQVHLILLRALNSHPPVLRSIGRDQNELPPIDLTQE